MKTKAYIQLQFSEVTEEQQDQLIALLADIGYTGFEEEEKILKAFISEADFSKDNLNEVLQIIPADYSQSAIKEQNWNAQWESSFEPIVVHDFVGIRAAFHQPMQQVKHEIIITPKMSFGTGHHATTYMMIEQMEAIDFTGKSVLDFGTGTAVLAILAEKMGAVAVDAIDYDEWSITNATENAATNHCSNIKLLLAETIATVKVYDIILANINLNVIQANMDAIKAVCKAGSLILLSGFIKADEAVMIQTLAIHGIQPLKTLQRAEWICILAQNT